MNSTDILTFVAVLVRFSVLIAVLPFVGDRNIPIPVKVLLALAVTIALYQALVRNGQIRPADAAIWGSTLGGVLGTVAMEAIFGLLLGFVARMAFEAVNFGGNLAGNFMGFAIASTFDPEQQSQTLVVAEIQMALAMLVFLALDGHHLMLRTTLDSYKIVGIGGAWGSGLSGLNASVAQKLVEISGQVIRFGMQIAAPVAVTLFGVNVAFGVVAKSMPQLNILVLSISVSAMVGLGVLLLSMPEFTGTVGNVFSKMTDWQEAVMTAVARGK